MPDTAKIDYINKIDFSKGFQLFHIMWPLKDLTRPKLSSMFETVVTDGNRRITLSWSLYIQNATQDPKKTWFVVCLRSRGKITPMIYRICLLSSTNVLLFEEIDFGVIDGIVSCGHRVSSSEVSAYPIDDLMLHCWIDIPNVICNGNNSDKFKLEEVQSQNSLQMTSNEVLSSNASEMFSRVVKGDYDPSSDASLIIVNKKDEELRRFRCHAVFLCNRSDVFERMFASEEWNINGRSVKINDVSARVMETVLEYIYTLALPDPSIDHDHLCGIIYAADKYKYNLPALRKWCVGVLIRKHVTTEHRIEQLILADRHNLTQLKAVCIVQLSFGFPASFSDNAKLKDTPGYLWSEIMKAVAERMVKTADIVLSAA